MATAATAETVTVGGEDPQKKDEEEEEEVGGGGRRRRRTGRFLVLFRGRGIVGGDEIVPIQITLIGDHPTRVRECSLHLLLLLLLFRRRVPPPPPSWMLPRARKAAEGTKKSTATVTATNADAMVRYRTTDIWDINPVSRHSCLVSGGGGGGEEDKEVRIQGTEGTANTYLGRFLEELEDEDCKKNEDDGDIGSIGEEKRRDEDEEKSSRSSDRRRTTYQGGGQGPDPVDCLTLISPLFRDGFLYTLFDERKYSNRDGAGLKNESEKKKKEEEEEEE